jgi:hypothetical protein
MQDALKKLDHSKLMVYLQTELTDQHWEDFENFFFGLDPNKSKPDRYLDAKFDEDDFRYKMTAFFYRLVFKPESVPNDIKNKVEKWAEIAMGDQVVKQKMEVLEQCMEDFSKLLKKVKAGDAFAITSP